MDNYELICFQMISNVGMAKSNFIEAIREARNGEFEKANALIDEGSKTFNVGHQVHAELLEKMAKGEKIEINLLLIHAEDQLMNAESFRVVAEEMIELYKQVKK